MIVLSNLSAIIRALNELQRMHQLNLELLEQYEILCRWITETNLPIPNSEKLRSLLSKTHALLEELYQSNATKYIQYSSSRRKVTDSRTDEEGTEPRKAMRKLFHEGSI